MGCADRSMPSTKRVNVALKHDHIRRWFVHFASFRRLERRNNTFRLNLLHKPCHSEHYLGKTRRPRCPPIGGALGRKPRA